MCRSLKRVWREWRVWRGEQWIFYMLIQTPWCSVTFKPGLHSLYSLPGQGCCCSSFMSFFTFLPESFHHLPWHVELLTRLSWGWLSSDLRVCLCGWRADKSLDVQSAAPQQKFPSWMLLGHSMDSKVLHSGSYPATCKDNRNSQSGPWGLQGITFWRPPSPLAHLLSTGTSPLIKGLGQPLQLLLRSRGGGRTSQAEPCAQGWRDKGTPRQGVGSWGWPGVNQQLH